MKTVLLVPGFHETMTSRDYAALIAAITAKGYSVRFVPIQWARTTIDGWVTQLERVYANYDPQHTVLAGFSFGAMAAFVAAARRNPAELWLFSFSPYFAEDLTSGHMKAAWLKQKGRRRVASFAKVSFVDLAPTVRCRTLLFVGQSELDDWPIMAERTNDAQKRLPRSSVVTIPGVGHNVTDPAYIAAIAGVL